MDTTAQLHAKTMHHFNERQRRMYAGSLARQYGWGGITRVHKETGMDPRTSMRGMRELEEEPWLDRVRKPGGGRKKAEDHRPHLLDAIELQANPKTDQRTIVKWTSHSLVHMAQAVRQRGFEIASTTVRRILKEKGYALKANKKDVEGGSDHPDRDEQFQHINKTGLKMQLLGCPRYHTENCVTVPSRKGQKLGLDWV